MIHRLGAWCARVAQRWVPDPFVFAIGLTFLTLGAGVLLGGNGPGVMVAAWGKGLWELLAFGMEMTLILVTGHALAQTRAVGWVIARVAAVPRSAGGAAALVALVACGFALVNWGLGLIAGALLARETARAGARNGVPMHYPLLGAAGYAGLLVWHGGLSGSAPLKVATAGHMFVEEVARIGGPADGALGFAHTVFSPLNLVCTALLLVVIPLVCFLLAPREAARMTPIPPAMMRATEETSPEGSPDRPTPADRLNHSRLLAAALALLGFYSAGRQLLAAGFQPNLGITNLTFLSLGLLLHQTPIAYVGAVGRAVRGAAGIILQFPFYAGIMGMMKYTNLTALLARAFVAVAGPRTFPALAFLSAGLVNLFVPSGGGQWAVQGGLLLEAAGQLGVPASTTILALAYGDEWTNMLQPFWALALLGITGLRARDLLGYTAVLWMAGGLCFLFVLLVF